MLKSTDVVHTLAFRTWKGLHNGNINVPVLYLKSTMMTIGPINTLLHHLKTTAVAIVSGLILCLGNVTSTLLHFFPCKRDDNHCPTFTPCPMSAMTIIRKPCMEGTRTAVLQEIENETKNVNGPDLIWIRGSPGVGKSALAANATI